ncbi:MAG TPA: hypothetical protein VIT68_03065 [Candidatus Gracilibacteria bacterium]
MALHSLIPSVRNSLVIILFFCLGFFVGMTYTTAKVSQGSTQEPKVELQANLFQAPKATTVSLSQEARSLLETQAAELQSSIDERVGKIGKLQNIKEQKEDVGEKERISKSMARMQSEIQEEQIQLKAIEDQLASAQ